MFVKAVHKPHQKDIKQLLYDPETRKMYSASIDGALIEYDQNYQPDEKARIGSITAACRSSQQLVISSIDGIILSFSGDTVEQLKIKTESRPRAMVMFNDSPVIADFNGNLYYCDQTFRFAEFSYDGRKVVNGINGLSLYGHFLAAALSSGHIALFDMDARISKGPFAVISVHEHPARAVVLLSEHAFISGGNDGRVYYSIFSSNEWHSLVISPLLLETEYIFDLKLSHDRKYLSVCGSGYVAVVIALNYLLSTPFADICTSSGRCVDVSLQAVIPMRSDCWATVFTSAGDVCYGCENGELIVCGLEQTDFHSIYLGNWEPIEIPEGKFALKNTNILDVRRLREFFDYGSMEVVEVLEQCPPMFLCCLEDEIALVCSASGLRFKYGTVNIKKRSKVRDAKNKEWDICFPIQADYAQGQELKLYMNANEDAYVAGKRFLDESGLIAHADVDQVDQIQQIRAFIEQNAPKAAIAEYIYPDNEFCFKFVVKLSAQCAPSLFSQALNSGDFDFMQVPIAPRLIDTTTVYKAYSHVYPFLGNASLDEAPTLLYFTLSYLNEFYQKTAQQFSAFLCVCAYFLQLAEDGRRINDHIADKRAIAEDFIQRLAEIFITSTDRPVIVMSGRLLIYVCNSSIKISLQNRADVFFMQCYEHLCDEDCSSLVAKAAVSITAYDPNYALLSGLYKQMVLHK